MQGGGEAGRHGWGDVEVAFRWPWLVRGLSGDECEQEVWDRGQSENLRVVVGYRDVCFGGGAGIQGEVLQKRSCGESSTGAELERCESALSIDMLVEQGEGAVMRKTR